MASEADTREHLRALVDALEGAFISTWQSTAAWQKELNAAREYLNRDEAGDLSWDHRVKHVTPSAGVTETCAGWKLVPMELTQPMREAWDAAPNGEDDDENMRAGYRAMLAAAPPAAGVKDVDRG